jgi:hypothetical protein
VLLASAHLSDSDEVLYGKQINHEGGFVQSRIACLLPDTEYS